MKINLKALFMIIALVFITGLEAKASNLAENSETDVGVEMPSVEINAVQAIEYQVTLDYAVEITAVAIINTAQAVEPLLKANSEPFKAAAVYLPDRHQVKAVSKSKAVHTHRTPRDGLNYSTV